MCIAYQVMPTGTSELRTMIGVCFEFREFQSSSDVVSGLLSDYGVPPANVSLAPCSASGAREIQALGHRLSKILNQCCYAVRPSLSCAPLCRCHEEHVTTMKHADVDQLRAQATASIQPTSSIVSSVR